MMMSWYALIQKQVCELPEKGRDLTQSYVKSPTEKSEKKRDNTKKTPPTTSIKNDSGPTSDGQFELPVHISFSILIATHW